MESSKIRIAIIGASGAIGRELIRAARQDSRVGEIILLVRRELEEWVVSNFTPRLTILKMASFDDFSAVKESLKGVDAFVCTLGSRTKLGEAEFRKVDYTYPLEFAKVAKELQIPYFSLLTSQGASPTSWFLYMKVKGQIEQAITQLQFQNLAIFRPGLLRNRDNDCRFVEKLASIIPGHGIQAADLGAAILEHAIQQKNSIQQGVSVFENSEIKNFLRNARQQR